MTDLVQDIEAYAELSALLADPKVDRAALLETYGLDENRWDALDDTWQARISAAEDANPNGMSSLLAKYAEGFARARRARSRDPILTFDRFLEVVRALRHGGDVGATLQRLGTTLPSLLASQQHWMEQLLKDDELAERFRRAVR
jgi:hypothetical protein